MKKVYIQIESAAEQQEHLKNQRKTLKVLQGVATDKENLTGRPQIDKLSRLKAATETSAVHNSSVDYVKRKKIELRSAETQTSPEHKEKPEDCDRQITAEDLTDAENPREYYWECLAEKRREALEKSLEENHRLYVRIEGLEEELNTSRQQLEEAHHLVSVLTEMLNEEEEEGQEQEEHEQQQQTADDDEETVEQKTAEQVHESLEYVEESSSDSNVTPEKQEEA